MNSILILPCGGKSTRFNSTKPKYMLTHPNGNLMLIEAIKNLDCSKIFTIIIILNKNHVDQHQVNLDKIKNKIYKMKKIEPQFLLLDTLTNSQSETVYKAIEYFNLQNSGIIIKDCDNQFTVQFQPWQNKVYIATLQNEINAINKGYVSLDEYGHLAGIIEKNVISNLFCAGAYSFKSGQDFKDAFLAIKKMKFVNQEEIYVSHIIQYLLQKQEVFSVEEVKNYIDWGTQKDWNKYIKEYRTLFVDIDGVLVLNSSEYFSPFWGETCGLSRNISVINNSYESEKNYIILTTARSEEYREITTQQLKKLGIKYHQLLCGLPHAQRVLINDFSQSNPYPSAIAINLQRDQDDLEKFLT